MTEKWNELPEHLMYIHIRFKQSGMVRRAKIINKYIKSGGKHVYTLAYYEEGKYRTTSTKYVRFIYSPQCIWLLKILENL